MFFSVVLLYWAENFAIGFYNVLRIAFVKVERPAGHLQKLFNVPFFIFHYGMFTMVHGVFVFAMFGDKSGATGFSGAFSAMSVEQVLCLAGLFCQPRCVVRV